MTKSGVLSYIDLYILHVFVVMIGKEVDYTVFPDFVTKNL